MRMTTRAGAPLRTRLWCPERAQWTTNAETAAHRYQHPRSQERRKSRIDYWDLKTPAFGIRIGPRTKTFIAKVGNSRITVGTYPAMSLADARRKALSIKAEGTPTPVSKLTFETAYERFKMEHVAAKKERTRRDYKRVLDKYFLPKLAKSSSPRSPMQC